MTTKGRLTSVSASGQAAQLGLRIGDTITHVNGRPFVEVGTINQQRSIEEIRHLREPFTLGIVRELPGRSPAEVPAPHPSGSDLPPSTAPGSAAAPLGASGLPTLPPPSAVAAATATVPLTAAAATPLGGGIAHAVPPVVDLTDTVMDDGVEASPMYTPTSPLPAAQPPAGDVAMEAATVLQPAPTPASDRGTTQTGPSPTAPALQADELRELQEYVDGHLTLILDSVAGRVAVGLAPPVEWPAIVQHLGSAEGLRRLLLAMGLRPGATHPWERLGLCWDEGPAPDPNQIDAQIRQAGRVLDFLASKVEGEDIMGRIQSAMTDMQADGEACRDLLPQLLRERRRRAPALIWRYREVELPFLRFCYETLFPGGAPRWAFNARNCRARSPTPCFDASLPGRRDGSLRPFRGTRPKAPRPSQTLCRTTGCCGPRRSPHILVARLPLSVASSDRNPQYG